MTNFGDLLGALLQSNTGQSAQSRIGNALQDLQANLGQVSGGQGGAGDLLAGLLEQAKTSLGTAAENPLQAGGIGAVLGSLLGGGGDSVKGALSGGVLAMLAGVAFKAMSNAGQAGVAASQGGEPPLGLKPPVTPAEHSLLETKAQLIMKGMMNIAKSDGLVSPDEIQRIVGKAADAGIGAQGQEWLMAELRQPLNLDAFAAEIPNPEIAAEVYAASLLAVEVDTPQERDYLRQFAEKTGLAPVVVQQIHQSLGIVM